MLIKIAICFITAAVFTLAQEAPVGSDVKPKAPEKKALEQLKGTIKGKIVWSSSRSSDRHDLWIMNADGTEQKQLTKNDNVDWYPRFSPDGKTVLFTRSKSGWVREADADIFDRWDTWIIDIENGEEKIVAQDATWASWRPDGSSIVFAQGSKVFVKNLENDEEELVFDAEEQIKKGTVSQQPGLSSDGKLLAVTLRGTKRETGIWNLDKKTWYSTGGGCQMEWFPDGKKVLRMNEGQGNGGTEVLALSIDSVGKPLDRISGLSIPKNIRFMDLPGRRSHEYFPKLDKSGKWMVWCATQYGHEHDIYDYEVYLWNTSGNKKKGITRLTFHSGNDRWPDIFVE